MSQQIELYFRYDHQYYSCTARLENDSEGTYVRLEFPDDDLTNILGKHRYSILRDLKNMQEGRSNMHPLFAYIVNLIRVCMAV